jgi:hypothetical protein
MKQILLSLAILVSATLHAQSTYDQVYDLLQGSCATVGCHSNADQAGSLDLEGSGASRAVRKADLYNKLVGVMPANTTAAGNGYKLVYAGQPYESFLFRKINNGLAPEVSLAAGEGVDMPGSGPGLENEEIELIRQWIMHGAPQTGTVIDTALISDYYNNNGINSLTQIPMPPAPGEGFQIHMGPFFLPPSQAGQQQDEVEFFQKYETNFPQDLEVHKIQTFMGTYSHHLILWKYRPGEDSNKGPGLRTDNAHYYTEIVNAVQFSETLELPDGSAFPWEANTVLDLNSHYINYSTTKTTACEVYINVYTQPDGTAAQDMESDIIPNYNIFIPNNSQEQTFSQRIRYGAIYIPFYIWGLTSHTHKYGTDFNIFMSDAQGNRGMQVFDAGCPGGVPGCQVENFDYQHPPTRYFEPFLVGWVNHGIISEAKFVNDGPQSVTWGETSNDEMMVTLMFYLLDTTGVNLSTGIRAPIETASVKLFPNPASDFVKLELGDLAGTAVSGKLIDLNGRILRDFFIEEGLNQFRLERGDIPPGVYLINLETEDGRAASGRLLFH